MTRPARILVADDNGFIRTLVKAALTTVGYTVDEAADGPSALAALATDPPDLLLLDLVMPGMSGFEVLERLEASGASPCPVMMLTTAAGEGDIAHAEGIGAADYLVKPFDKDELRARVAVLLGERETPPV